VTDDERAVEPKHISERNGKEHECLVKVRDIKPNEQYFDQCSP